MTTTEETNYLGSATYDPLDNKIRFYPHARLSKPDYERIRSAGFIWAPKQELFVAPMWTPSREDMMLEWCGEVGDEDKSLVERQEERADRFTDYSASRRQDAEQAHKQVESICDRIPLGQPILVGHHSEKHARKDAERIENGMRKAVRMWETAEYWKQRAAGAIRHAKYKELPAVRARRIKTIEADKRKQERYAAQYESTAKFWRGEMFLKHKETGERRPFEVTHENALRFSGSDSTHISCEFPLAKYPRALPASQYEGAMSIWSALGGSDGPSLAIITVDQAKEIVLNTCDRVARSTARWLTHYNNRLEYERAMLAESGGTASDQVKPEKGGACKCWASHRGGWSYIVRVNQVSVTVLDNWGNGGGNFTRTIPFDKLSSIWTAHQVESARAEGRFVEYADKTGFGIVERNAAPSAPVTPKEPDQDKATFDALKQTLKAGVQVVSANQLFPTPPELAKRMVELAELAPGQRILEPSAGTGAIVGEMPFAHGVIAVEINRTLCESRLSGLLPDEGQVRCADFLTCNGDLGKFDRILMNPPFERGADIFHIQHALGFLNPGGRLVAICANGPRQQEKLQPIATSWEELPTGTFKESGTNVNTVLLTIEV